MINPDLRGYSYNEPFPFLIIENVFSDDQLEIIWKELEYYCSDYDNFFLSPESTGGAMDGPKYIKKNAGLFLQEAWARPNCSAINRFISPVLMAYPKSDWVDKNYYFQDHQWNQISVLISHYKDGDYYKPHRDLTMATHCLWLYKEPKKFEGGEFKFTDYDLTIEGKNNSMVIFPGPIKHEVSEVKNLSTNPLDGRFCVSYFTSWIGNGK